MTKQEYKEISRALEDLKLHIETSFDRVNYIIRNLTIEDDVQNQN